MWNGIAFQDLGIFLNRKDKRRFCSVVNVALLRRWNALS